MAITGSQGKSLAPHVVFFHSDHSDITFLKHLLISSIFHTMSIYSHSLLLLCIWSNQFHGSMFFTQCVLWWSWFFKLLVCFYMLCHCQISGIVSLDLVVFANRVLQHIIIWALLSQVLHFPIKNLDFYFMGIVVNWCLNTGIFRWIFWPFFLICTILLFF